MSHPYGQGSHPGPYPYGPVHTQVVTQPYRSSTAHIVIAWIVAVLSLGYMLPWAIAATRNKSNAAVIALINLLLGWSLVGWIVALVMSLASEPQPVVFVNTAIMPPQYPAYGQPAAQTPMLPPAPYPPATYPPAPYPPASYAPVQPSPQPQYQAPEPTAILPPYDDSPWQRPNSTDYR